MPREGSRSRSQGKLLIDIILIINTISSLDIKLGGDICICSAKGAFIHTHPTTSTYGWTTLTIEWRLKITI